ncbi:MAG: phosphotransferase [Candidatus Promineifilaceae bacterium]
MKLRVICVGKSFVARETGLPRNAGYPANILLQTDDFQYALTEDISDALTQIHGDQDLDIVFLDADDFHLTSSTMFVTQLRELRPHLPVIAFTHEASDVMRYLLRSGATWHYLKNSAQLYDLATDINDHIFLPVRWEDVFDYYAQDKVGPRIEPGIGASDLDLPAQSREEQYIIKRLFANSDVVQIFRMDEGFSGSRIYTVKPRHQLKRILKIGPIEDLEAVREKQERLIQPRLFRQVGQIRGKVVSAKHLAGACYSLAGSNQEVLTLAQFLQDQNRVRKPILDKILEQLRTSLRELYNGSVETELRYWSPLYNRILPPNLILESAVWAKEGDGDGQFVLDASSLTHVSAVPNNQTLLNVQRAVRDGQHPELLLKDFEIAETDPAAGTLYLQDTLIDQFPADPLLKDKDQPLLRFKVHLQPSQHELLSHPIFRPGKKVSIRGVVTETRETLLAHQIGDLIGHSLNLGEPTIGFAATEFLSPLENIRFLLWEIGREDMITPSPIVAPVIHGDLNASNILIEAGSDAPLWLIDFSDARPGHIYFDLAKLEVEFRTHVFYALFSEMVTEKLWDAATATKFLLLLENLLLQFSEASFEAFAAGLRDCQSDWYDDLYTQFPLYFENLLYFLFSLRQLARSTSPERFTQHYPVAVFFHSIAALKYEILGHAPWLPWARRLALCCALVHGKAAVLHANRPNDASRLLGELRQRSALALIRIGEGEQSTYLMQWNKNWSRFNLVGGRINNELGDRDSFGRTLQRKLLEELGLRNPKDYRIIRERQPVIEQQFSRRQHIYKDYEFRVFELELLPRHPRNAEEFAHFEQRLTSDSENVLLSAGEIGHLRTVDGRPISETTRVVLQVIGEIPLDDRTGSEPILAFHLDELRPLVTRGRAQITGSLVNVGFGKLVENIVVEPLARPGYEIEPQSALFHISRLDAGYDYPLEIHVQPREQDAKLTLRATFYDTRGNEHQQIIEHPLRFRTPVFSLFQLDNPYVVGRPLDSGAEQIFVGREDLFAWFGATLLRSGRPQAVLLASPPRMGKSSVLLQLVNGTLGRAIRTHAHGVFIPVYVNLGDLRVSQAGEFFFRLSHIIARALRNRGVTVQPLDGKNGELLNYHRFDIFLDDVERALPQDGRLILLLDDLDQLRVLIEEQWLAPDALAYLHSLMVHRSQLTFVLAGSMQLLGDYWQLIRDAAETRILPRLTRRQTEILVCEPVQPHVAYDQAAVERIWRLTGGHPYLTQLLCSRAVSEFTSGLGSSKEIVVADLSGVVDRLLDEDDGYMLALWENCSSEERLVLTAAANGAREDESLVLLGSIAAQMRLSSDEGQRELAVPLAGLCRQGLLVPVPKTLDARPVHGGAENDDDPKSDAYQFAFDLLRQWLMRHHPFGQVLNEAYQTTTRPTSS